MTTRDLSVLEGLDPEAVKEAVMVLRRESDRGAILVAIAILDDVFTNRLTQLLDRGNSEARSRILSPPLGALSSFSSKVDLAFCIGIIPKQIYDDIRLVNKLRNLCAHDWGAFRITQDILVKFIQPMVMKKAIDAANSVKPIFFPAGTSPKDVLVSTLAGLVTFVNLYRPLPHGAVTTTLGDSIV